MKKRTLVSLGLLLVAAAPVLFAQSAAARPAAAGSVIKYIAAALAVGWPRWAAASPSARSARRRMAAMSENPDLSGRALPFVGLAEGICLWGFIVALMILSA